MLILLLISAALSIFYSCQPPGKGPTYDTYISIKIDGNEYTADPNAYDFGFADPAGIGKDGTATISNKTAVMIQVT